MIDDYVPKPEPILIRHVMHLLTSVSVVILFLDEALCYKYASKISWGLLSVLVLTIN